MGRIINVRTESVLDALRKNKDQHVKDYESTLEEK